MAQAEPNTLNTECNISFPIPVPACQDTWPVSNLGSLDPPTQCVYAIQEISIKKNFFTAAIADKIRLFMGAGGRANKSKVKAP